MDGTHQTGANTIFHRIAKYSPDRRERVTAIARIANRLPRPDSPALVADYSSDGTTIALVCSDGGTRFYSFVKERWIYVRDHATDILSGGFSHAGTDFVSADRSRVVVIRSVQ